MSANRTVALDSVRATALDNRPGVPGGVLVESLEDGAWIEEGKATLHHNPAPGWGWLVDFDDGNRSRPAYVRLMLGERLAQLLGLYAPEAGR